MGGPRRVAPREVIMKMFLEWVEVKFHSLVVDHSDEPVRLVEQDLTDDSATGTEH